MKILDQTPLNPDQPKCIGTGLVALDVIISTITNTNSQFLAGGSCGNVLTILSYLGWLSYPIARLSNNVATELLIEDFNNWDVKQDFLQVESSGSTPVIIHRILKDRRGNPKHRFEFRNPEDGKYLPSYKPCLAKSVPSIIETSPRPNVFYLDRISRGSIELAKQYKSLGAVVFFEPTNMKDLKGFDECVKVADIVKFSHDRISNYDDQYPKSEAGIEIQTIGEKGLKYRRHGQQNWIHVEGYQIENTIDSAGAGDWCSAAFIYSLFPKHNSVKSINEEDVISALKFGQAFSALNCMFEGARGLMYQFKRNELLEYIEPIMSQRGNFIDHPNMRAEQRHVDIERKISSLFKAV
ncbi:hypothetical protein [Pedobacter antarcticus]|uniref:hypothetical protein n=1 Tax=Pedobacter antarcticus TaxID=34086 RepID=UPI00292E8D25|nr:hypothetical protein [Pedobacter antarcticus]